MAEVDVLERDVARREDLSGQQLPSNVLLAELLASDRRVTQSLKTNGNQHLYVVSEGQYGEVAGKDNVVAVDPRGVDLIEGTLTGDVDGGAELHAGNLYGLGCSLHEGGKAGGQD